MASAPPDAQKVKDRLSYDADAGQFRWRVTRGSAVEGELAGTINTRGYLYISLDRRKYPAHRLALFHASGIWPEAVDHKNGEKLDNRLRNLRPATFAQNNANCPRPRTNTSGFKGVKWVARKKKWAAIIRVNKQSKHLGYFHSKDDAHASYCKAAVKHFGEFARFE
jgi:hypothetical protein